MGNQDSVVGQLVDIHCLTWLTQQRTRNLLGNTWIQAFKQLKKKGGAARAAGLPTTQDL